MLRLDRSSYPGVAFNGVGLLVNSVLRSAFTARMISALDWMAELDPENWTRLLIGAGAVPS